MSEGPFTVTVDGVDELDRNWLEAAHYLEQDSAQAALTAADEAVATMQERHPYQDRTYNLSGGMHGEPAGNPTIGAEGETVHEATIVIPAEYASFVDKGTSRARPYPFTPRGEAQAERTVTREERAAVERFERSCIRG